MKHIKHILSRFYARLFDVAQDKQQRSLARAYIAALGIIAALTIAGHFSTSYMASNQRESAEITFQMTSLRSLMDKVVLQSSSYNISGASFGYELLNQSIDKLKGERRSIEAHNGDTIETLFDAEPYLLNQRVARFIDAVDEFVKRRSTSNRAIDELIASINSHSIDTAINLDLALEKYQTDVIAQAETFLTLQYLSAFIILLVLFLEAVLIFRPLVARLGEYHKDLIRLALTDALTGMNNRRAFMQLAHAALAHFNRSKKPFALVLADLDKFKSVNDTYGHKVGDLVLKHYSNLMLQSFRENDIIGRIGGEEFALFLPETSPQDALQKMESFRKSVMITPCPYTDKDGEEKMLNYTSSFGAVSVSTGAWTLDGLFIIADENLYKAKEQGRNCVVLRELAEKEKFGVVAG